MWPFCFALHVYSSLRNFFYPRLQVRLVMKGLCHAQGALGEEHCHLQAFLLKMACSMAKRKERNSQGG